MIRLRTVKRNHYLCLYQGDLTKTQRRRLPAAARRFLCNAGDATHAIVARDEGRIVGILRYYDAEDTIASGTWVATSHRGLGLAFRMWALALKGLDGIEVTTISRGGDALVRALIRAFPEKEIIHHGCWAEDEEIRKANRRARRAAIKAGLLPIAA